MNGVLDVNYFVAVRENYDECGGFRKTKKSTE